MTPLDTHLELFREVLAEKNPLTYLELSSEILARAGKRNLATSPHLVARLTLAALANLEPAKIAFPDIPKILVLLADGRIRLKT